MCLLKLLAVTHFTKIDSILLGLKWISIYFSIGGFSVLHEQLAKVVYDYSNPGPVHYIPAAANFVEALIAFDEAVKYFVVNDGSCLWNCAFCL